MHVQRWRLTFARASSAADLAPREQAAAWDATLAAAAGDATGAGPADRPRFVPAAPLSTGMSADRELTDLLLARRLRMPDLRETLVDTLPDGHRLVDLHDVWVGEPSLPSQLVAGDYLVGLDGPTTGLDGTVAALLRASSVPRRRQKGDSVVTDDQRPLIIDVRVVAPDCLWMRLRFDPVLGTGRPEDVIHALGELAGTDLAPVRRHRERLWLRDELAVHGDELPV
jgi:hypothetical protein